MQNNVGINNKTPRIKGVCLLCEENTPVLTKDSLFGTQTTTLLLHAVDRLVNYFQCHANGGSCHYWKTFLMTKDELSHAISSSTLANVTIIMGYFNRFPSLSFLIVSSAKKCYNLTSALIGYHTNILPRTYTKIKYLY